MKKLGFLFVSFVLLANLASAQTFTPKVSKDSVGVLTARLEAVKASAKLQNLKIKEAEEENDVEKLRIKVLEAEGNVKASAQDQADAAEKTKAGNLDAKAAEKIAKKAKSDVADAQKALDRYNKQIEKVEALRNEIKAEERKLTYKKPYIIFDYK
ncbi:MAG: hypothetical protein EOO87_07625 [Pedobacter sp.]|nr:MAG: hypothetical protein EOO87_07625 [Pedobacter sp.]